MAATAQDGVGLCIDTELGRKSPSLGGGKRASCPWSWWLWKTHQLSSQGSCGLAANEGVKGNSRERILVRQRNHFSDHSQHNNSKEGRKQEQESENRSIQGSTAVALEGLMCWAQAHSNKIPALITPGAYLYVLAQPLQRRRLAARPVHHHLFPPYVLHHDALFQRGAPVEGRSCQVRLFGLGLTVCGLYKQHRGQSRDPELLLWSTCACAHPGDTVTCRRTHTTGTGLGQ